MFSVNTLRGPPFKNCTYSTHTIFFPFVWSNSARNSIFPGTTKMFSFETQNRSSGNRVVLYPIPPKNWIFVDLPRSVDDFNQICFILKYFSWSLCPTAGSNKDQPAGQQDVVGLGHLEDPHVGGQQHHLLPRVGWEIFQCCLWASKTKLSISLFDRSIDEHNALYQAVGLQLARGDLKWLTRLENPENEEKKSKQIKQNPNDLRLMVRETTSTRRPPGSSSSGSSRPPRAPQDAVEEEQYYDQDNAGVTFLKIDFLANFLLSIILWWIICCATSFIVRVKERGLGSTQYSQQFWAYTIYYMLLYAIYYTLYLIPFMIGELNLFVFGDSNV